MGIVRKLIVGAVLVLAGMSAFAQTPSYVGSSPLLPIIQSLPEGGWAKVNQNLFQDVWTPAALRPLANGGNPTPAKLISAWSGFAWDSNRGDLILYGGGHANYSGNDVYRWRSSTLQWERAALPSEIQMVNAPDLFLAVDGAFAAPPSVHSYQNHQFFPLADRFLAWGGAAWNTGSAYLAPDENNPGQFRRTGPYLFDPAKADGSKVGGTTGSHVQREAPYPEILGGGMWENRDIYKNIPSPGALPGVHVPGCSAYAQEGGREVSYVLANPPNGSTSAMLYRYQMTDAAFPSLDTMDVAGIIWTGTSGVQRTCSYDPVKKVFVRTQTTGIPFLFWDLNTPGAGNQDKRVVVADTVLDFQNWLTSNAVSLEGCGMQFDPLRNKHVLWCGAGNVWTLSSPANNVASGWTMQQVPPATVAVPPAVVANGVLGKWKYAQHFDVFVGLVDPDNGEVWIYKPIGWQAPGASNAAPVVNLVAPTAGASFTAPANIGLSANASDTDGNITRVEFYRGAVLVATVNGAGPYNATDVGVAPGAYSYTARAYDNSGGVSTSAAVAVTVTVNPLNMPPTVALTAPVAGASVTAPASVALAANASDSDGSVVKVEFYRDALLVATVNGAGPFNASDTLGTSGTYSYTARAYDNGGSVTISAAVMVTVQPPAAINVASQTNGGVAAASSVFGGGFVVSAVNNGDRKGQGWGSGGGWLDANRNNFPDWVQITFNGVKTISEINVFTIQDAFAAPVEPTETQTFSLYGITSYQVQYWDGSAWALVPGGTITGNNLVWRKITFAPVSTQFIRVVVTGSTDGYSRIAEIEAWTGSSGPSNAAPTVSLTSPTTGATLTTPATVSLGATAADSDGSISKVEFYRGATLVATVNGAGPYNASDTGLVAGSYSYTARAYDNAGGVTTSAAVVVTVSNPNVAPTVNLTAPAGGASYTAPATIVLTASASDGDGSVSRVEFYSGSTLIGTVNAAPYTFSWSNVGTGSYTLSARAYDNLNAVGTSTAVVVTVNAPNAAPTVNLTSPTVGATFTAPATVSLGATAADSDGSISKVEFYRGATLVATVNGAGPYTASDTGVAGGSYSYTARAYDNAGGITTSIAVAVTVNGAANVPPTVNLTSPTVGATFTAPATVSLGATAADSDGSISKVEFYRGATLVATVNGAGPYSASDTGVAAGSYSYTARAYDNAGGITTSAAVAVTVNAAGGGTAVNVAAQANGGVAIASSVLGSGFAASAVNNGDRKGQGFGSGGGWLDGNRNSFPDWVQIAFNGVKTISEINVFTIQDAFAAPVEPTETQTFSLYGITSYQVQYWDGSAWALVPGGTITGNNLVWRKITFAPVSTQYIRVLVTGSTDGYSRIAEIEAWTGSSGPSNAAPTVSLTSPTTGATLTAPATVSLGATAADSDGSISKVEFYRGATLVATVNGAGPYNASDTGLVAGSYSYTARAYDNAGGVTTSAAVVVTVSNPNVAPTVNLTAPAGGASYTAPATIVLTASASDGDGSVSRVEFYSGSTLIGTVNAAPYTFSWSNVGTGSYTLSARAYDNLNAVGTSTAVVVTVNAPNAAPTVNLTSPTVGATFTAPATVSLSATAADSDGSISKVEFYRGATLVATVNGAGPYTASDTGVAGGSYSYTARAYDNAGGITTSIAVAVTVNGAANVPPTVNLTSPTVGATFTAPATVSLGATAADSDGSISKVEFYRGATLVATVNGAGPYSASDTGVAAGSYSYTARAYDNAGGITTSAAVAVTVNAAGGGTAVNVAAQANGGVAIASSVLGSGFAASAVNNGDRKGQGFGSGGGWLDGNRNSFPDWVQITFNGVKTISEINVFTIQDAFAAPVEPTETQTFSLYGITSYQVQYWDGSAWALVPGGTITGNNLVWRKITFAPVSTQYIRVVVTGSTDGYSRIAEIEAWTAP